MLFNNYYLCENEFNCPTAKKIESDRIIDINDSLGIVRIFVHFSVSQSEEIWMSNLLVISDHCFYLWKNKNMKTGSFCAYLALCYYVKNNINIVLFIFKYVHLHLRILITTFKKRYGKYFIIITFIAVN